MMDGVLPAVIHSHVTGAPFGKDCDGAAGAAPAVQALLISTEPPVDPRHFSLIIPFIIKCQLHRQWHLDEGETKPS